MDPEFQQPLIHSQFVEPNAPPQLHDDLNFHELNNPNEEPNAPTLEELGEDLCKFCYSGKESGELISPCSCKGSVRYVHRACLDRWRATSMNPQSFYTCETCKFDYVLEYQSQRKNPGVLQYCKYVTLTMFDLCMIFTIFQTIVIILALLTWACDPYHQSRNWFLFSFYPQNAFFDILRLYILGYIWFFVLLGVLTILVGGVFFLTAAFCVGGSRRRRGRRGYYMPYYYRSTFWDYFIIMSLFRFTMFDCFFLPICLWPMSFRPHHWGLVGGFGGGGGGRRDGNAGTIICIIILALFFIVGFVVATVLLVVLVYYILKRRNQILYRKDKCRLCVVKDLSEEA